MLTTLLPVIDLMNNIVTLNNFLTSLNKVQLPGQLTENPQYKSLVSDFNDWRFLLWEEFFEGLVDGEIVPQAQEVETFFKDNLKDITLYHSVFYGSSKVTPKTLQSADQVSSLIVKGEGYAQQLDEIAKSIEGADEKKVADLLAKANTLEAQFSKQEADLTEKAISSGEDLVAAAVDVAVAVGTEGDEIQPLINGVTTLGKDVITELVMTSEIHTTLLQLEDIWEKLDQATIELFKMKLLVKQVDKIVEQESGVLMALSSISSQWTTIVDITSDDANWDPSGMHMLNEWSERMNNVAFTTYSQQFTSSQPVTG